MFSVSFWNYRDKPGALNVVILMLAKRVEDLSNAMHAF